MSKVAAPGFEPSPITVQRSAPPMGAGIQVIWGPPEADNNPLVKSIQGIYRWDQVEPQEGVYDWRRLHADLKMAYDMQKPVMLQLNCPAPAWIAKYVAVLGTSRGGNAYQYWDPLYMGYHRQVLTNKTISGASNTLGDIPSTALTTPAARGYALQATHGSSNYAASTVYYFGNMGGNMTTVAQRNKIYIPANGTITKAYVSYFVSGTLASTEAITFAIRHNNTTDYTISNTATLDAAIVDFNSTSLNIAVAAGDFIEMKVTTPAFATAPTTVRCSVVLFIE